MMRATLLVLLTGGLLCGCGGGSAGTGGGDPAPNGGTPGGAGTSLPSAVIVSQEAVDMATFEAMAQEDAALGAVASGLSLTMAGTASDSAGVEVIWAEGPDGDGTIRTALRHCAGDDCVHAVQTTSDAGLSWTDASGAPLEARTIGRPVLLKNLEGFDLDGKTVVAAMGLSSTDMDFLEPSLVPSYDYATRSFVALNTFGDAFGTPMSDLVRTATESGTFDAVLERQYVREDTLRDTFESLDGMDAVVWLTQGVREETQGDWRASRTVGYTANRGGFGDVTVDRNELAELLNFNLAGGPGLVIIAGSASYSDGSDNQPDAASAWQKISDRDRVVVGVEGMADVADILLAVETFLEVYLSGEVTLDDALDAGSAALAGTGARLMSNQLNVDLGRTWSHAPTNIWDQLGFVPSSSRIIIPIAATPYCAPPGQTRIPDDEDYTQPFADVTFDGAYFSGTKEAALTGVTVSVSIVGTVTGLDVDDRIFLEVWGDIDEQFREFHAFGEATIREVTTDDDGTVTVGFNGTAFATPYTNGEGESCVLNGPKIQTTTSALAAIVLTP